MADEHHMMVSLETHNPKNVEFYQHLGFQIVWVLNNILILSNIV